MRSLCVQDQLKLDSSPAEHGQVFHQPADGWVVDFSSALPDFLQPQWWPPSYKWNIREDGVKDR